MAAEGCPTGWLVSAALLSPLCQQVGGGSVVVGLSSSVPKPDWFDPGWGISTRHGEGVVPVASRAIISHDCRHCCREGKLLFK